MENYQPVIGIKSAIRNGNANNSDDGNVSSSVSDDETVHSEGPAVTTEVQQRNTSVLDLDVVAIQKENRQLQLVMEQKDQEIERLQCVLDQKQDQIMQMQLVTSN